MGGGGGGQSTNIEFNDTSERIYRDSSERAAGYTVEGGGIYEDRDRDTHLVEKDDRITEQLDLQCRTLIKDMATKLSVEVDRFIDDRTHLTDRAHTAWNRAISMFPSFRIQLGTELDDIKTEFLNRIYQWELQWARTAGSSLNCLVADMKIKADTELARRLGSVLASQLNQFRQHETQALQIAFQNEFTAHTEVNKVAFGHVSNLLSVLKGSYLIDEKDRSVDEEIDDSMKQIRIAGNYFRSSKSIAPDVQAYLDTVAELEAVADDAESAVPTAPPAVPAP